MKQNKFYRCKICGNSVCYNCPVIEENQVLKQKAIIDFQCMINIDCFKIKNTTIKERMDNELEI